MSIEYDGYLEQHRDNVRKGAEWLRTNLTDVLNGYEGFYDEIKEAGVNKDLLLVLGRESLKVLLPKYLKEHEVDGIFAFNDMLAYETLNVLKKENRKDIRVVGFDNIQELFNFPIKISTIGSDKKAMAKIAVNVLLEKIENKDERLEHHIFDVFLSTEENE